MGYFIDLQIADTGFDLLLLKTFRIGISWGNDNQGRFTCLHLGIFKVSMFITFQLGGK